MVRMEASLHPEQGPGRPLWAPRAHRPAPAPDQGGSGPRTPAPPTSAPAPLRCDTKPSPAPAFPEGRLRCLELIRF